MSVYLEICENLSTFGIVIFCTPFYLYHQNDYLSIIVIYIIKTIIYINQKRDRNVVKLRLFLLFWIQLG